MMRRAIPIAFVVALCGIELAGPRALSADVPRSRPSAPNEATRAMSRGGGWVRRENARLGTSHWRIPRNAKHGIVGFADKVSARREAKVTLFVDTFSDSFRVQAYRLGYYQGLGGRRIWTSRSTEGVNQPNPTITPDTNMVETSWDPSITFRVGRRWPEGTYLLKLVSSTGGQHYVPLIVRNDASHADLVIQHDVTTWQAYNRWGGASLYHGTDGTFEERSRVVSFDRPYSGRGAGALLTSLPYVALVEKTGLNVTYSTDLDLHARPGLTKNHRALISLAHDEYWSTSMRDGATAARAAGVNLAFLGANAIYRHIRLEPSPIGPDRHVVAYKRAQEDPLFGIDDSEVTSNWREPPLLDPESELLGAMYECNPVDADLVVADADQWVFAGTGMDDGDHVDGAVHLEYDRIFPDAPTPRTIQVLAHSPLSCKGQPRAADMTYYTARGDAGVFDVASQGWVMKIRCFDPVDSPTCDKRAVRITLNVLRAFAVGPSGKAHPSIANAAAFGYMLTDPTNP
jgi:hypothetical protein